MKHLKSRSAFSLVEAAIVLAAIGLVLGSIWVIMESTRNNARAAMLQQQTTLIINNIRQYYAMRALPTGVTGETTAANFTCTLQNSGVFPEDTCNSTCASCSAPASSPRPVNIYNGTILVNVVNTSPYITVNINHAYIDTKGCTTLVTNLSTKAGLLGLNSVRVNSGTTRTSFPISPSTAASDCNAGTDNSIDLVFDIKH